MVLTTKRLLLRRMDENDYEDLCEILQDAKTMHFYEHAFEDEEVREWLDRQLQRYEKDGVGLWAVILRETGEFVGQCGLTYQEVEGEQVLEVGYLFKRRHWKNGYAAEAAKGCRDYAFERLKATGVGSIVRVGNSASQKVAMRNGMRVKKRFIKHYMGIDMPHDLYWVERSDTESSAKGY